MAEYNKGKPLTKEVREGLCEEARRVWGTRFQAFSADTIFDYEATVAALEVEVERLSSLAATGEAVKGMAGHDWMLCPPGHIGNSAWTVLDGKTGDLVGAGDTALAALRAAKGEK